MKLLEERNACRSLLAILATPDFSQVVAGHVLLVNRFGGFLMEAVETAFLIRAALFHLAEARCE